MDCIVPGPAYGAKVAGWILAHNEHALEHPLVYTPAPCVANGVHGPGLVLPILQKHIPAGFAMPFHGVVDGCHRGRATKEALKSQTGYGRIP